MDIQEIIEHYRDLGNNREILHDTAAELFRLGVSVYPIPIKEVRFCHDRNSFIFVMRFFSNTCTQDGIFAKTRKGFFIDFDGQVWEEEDRFLKFDDYEEAMRESIEYAFKLLTEQ